MQDTLSQLPKLENVTNGHTNCTYSSLCTELLLLLSRSELSKIFHCSERKSALTKKLARVKKLIVIRSWTELFLLNYL